MEIKQSIISYRKVKMNAAWRIITDMNEISISMSEHKTTENLAKTGAFTVSIGTEDTVVACDYVGVESAKKVPDKFAKAGFHATKSTFVNAFKDGLKLK